MLSGNWVSDSLAITSLMVLALLFVAPFFIRHEQREQ